MPTAFRRGKLTSPVSTMTTRDSASPLAPTPIGGYRQYVEVAAASRLLFVSGQIGQTVEGVVPADGCEQCRLAWVNVLHQLDAAGYTAAQLVKATAFLTSVELIEAHQRARNEVLGTRQPALSVVVVSQLADPRWKVEVEVVAAG
jgi:2-iminobutanoate/2-iminopropanoate deaminase